MFMYQRCQTDTEHVPMRLLWKHSSTMSDASLITLWGLSSAHAACLQQEHRQGQDACVQGTCAGPDRSLRVYA